MEDDFIGSFMVTPTGATVKIVGWDGISKRGSIKLYTWRCSVCSKDLELFPEEERCAKGDFIRGIIPCGCSKRRAYTEAQNLVRVNRLAKDRGLVFLGWVGGL